MNTILSPSVYKKILFFYKFTFYLIGWSLMVQPLIIVFLVSKHLIDIDGYFSLITIATTFIMLIISALIMLIYAFYIVWYFWKKDNKQNAIRALGLLLCMHVFAGYIWFYRFEIKKKNLECKFLW